MHWTVSFVILPHMYLFNLRYIDGLVQGCSISIANALEILQSFTSTEPSISFCLFCLLYFQLFAVFMSYSMMLVWDMLSSYLFEFIEWLKQNIPSWYVMSIYIYIPYDTDMNRFFFHVDKYWTHSIQFLFACKFTIYNIDGLVQGCSNSIANTHELMQSCTKPLICFLFFFNITIIIELFCEVEITFPIYNDIVYCALMYLIYSSSFSQGTVVNADENAFTDLEYRKVSNIRRTKCQNLNDSRLVLELSVPNPLKPSVKSIMKM